MATDATYGMTPQGFIPKRLADILKSINTRLSDIVEPSSGEFLFQNVTDDSVSQQLVGVFSEAMQECWNAAYQGSVQFDPLKNSGAGQAGTVQLNAMLKAPGAATIIMMRLGGIAGTEIPIGSIIGTADGMHQYATLSDVNIGEDETVDVEAREIQMTMYVPENNTVIAILTPVCGGGWRSATNIDIVSEPTLAETDTLLRIRQQRSTSLTAYRTIDAIAAAILNVPGVSYRRIYQNSKFFPEDDRGIPFKEVAAVVEGGSNEDIAEALFLRLPTGQIGHGNTIVPLFDKQGIAYNISFSRPIEIPIWVSITLELVNRALFPDDGPDLIRKNIIAFAKYGGEGNEDGFPPGADIILSRLYTPINLVAGHGVTELTIGKSSLNLHSQDLSIAWNEVGIFDSARINITIL